ATEDALRVLQRIVEEPIQRYGFSPYSARLFPSNAGVASIASPVRRALLPDCVEYDLASCHLAIAAREWGCLMLYDYLARGESFWPLILAHMGLPYSEATKAAVKRGSYGLVY